MMATVPHVTSGLGLRKFQVDGFLLTRVYLSERLTIYEAKNEYSLISTSNIRIHNVVACTGNPPCTPLDSDQSMRHSTPSRYAIHSEPLVHFTLS